jgi:hypothetical protein
MTALFYAKRARVRKRDTPQGRPNRPPPGLTAPLDAVGGVLADPGTAEADLRTAARVLDRMQSTSLTTLPLLPAVVARLRRFLRPAPGSALLTRMFVTAGTAAAGRAVAAAPGLEPLTAGAPCRRVVPPGLLRDSDARTPVRQGRLGDCWLVAVMDACEVARPGYLRGLVRVRTEAGESGAPGGPDAAAGLREGTVRGPGRRQHGARLRLATVRLHSPVVTVPLLRRLPGLPLRRLDVPLSTAVPRDRRAGGHGLSPNAASLVEKAAVIVWAQGSYRRLARDFAGIGFALLTGGWALARPVPQRLETVARWLQAGRPVVASTLVRPGGSFTLPREDDPERVVAVMDGHVYSVRGVLRCDEDGVPSARSALRVHLRNPVGGPDPRSGSGGGAPECRRPPMRRKDLYLSVRQFRRAFISVNAGPRLR